jgi:hypothetical protein
MLLSVVLVATTGATYKLGLLYEQRQATWAIESYSQFRLAVRCFRLHRPRPSVALTSLHCTVHRPANRSST